MALLSPAYRGGKRKQRSVGSFMWNQPKSLCKNWEHLSRFLVEQADGTASQNSNVTHAV